MTNQDKAVVQTTCKHSKADLHVASTNTQRIPPSTCLNQQINKTPPFQPLGFAIVTAFHSWSNFFLQREQAVRNIFIPKIKY